MITLIEETKVVTNGTDSYTLDLQFTTAADFANLPSATRPFTKQYYPIAFDYGVPAVGSVATYTQNGTTYTFTSTGEWVIGGGTAGDSKNWMTISLSIADLRNMSQGGYVVKNFTTPYSDTNFKNDYIICNVQQKQYHGASSIFMGEQMNRVYVNTSGFADVAAYLYKTIVSGIKEYGFDHNYYRTIALYAGCNAPSSVGEPYILQGPNALEGKNVIYLQDVSQQKWEYNYDADEAVIEGKDKRESLDNDITGRAFVISIKGADPTKNAAFLYCLQDSQAAYWYNDTTTPDNSKVKWANIEAGKFYSVTFDGTGTGEHGTLRWLCSVHTVPGSTEMWCDELSTTEKNRLITEGIAFENNKYCAEILVDTTEQLKCSLVGNRSKELANIFSFNNQFGEASEYYMQYIGRPNSYTMQNYEYTKEDDEGNPVRVIERSGSHVWTADVEGLVVQMIVPDNCDEEGVAHRDSYLLRLDLDNALDTASIYRHTITVTTPGVISEGNYELNLSMCAVNSEAGDTGVEYLLHSDESYQDYDWILPVSGTIGKVIGVEYKGTQIPTMGDISHIYLNAAFPYAKFDQFWDNLAQQTSDTYYLFATAERGAGAVTCRIVKTVATETSYEFYLDSDTPAAHSSFRVVTTGSLAGWYKWNGTAWESISSVTDFCVYDNPITLTNVIEVSGANIQVGWDNEFLKYLFSCDEEFSTMNRVARSNQAMRMLAGWQYIEDKEVRTLFIDYIDPAGEFNRAAVITDENAYDYWVRDYRSEVLAVKTPMTLRISEVKAIE